GWTAARHGHGVRRLHAAVAPRQSGHRRGGTAQPRDPDGDHDVRRVGFLPERMVALPNVRRAALSGAQRFDLAAADDGAACSRLGCGLKARFLAAAFVVPAMLALCPRADAANSAVILTYYRFAEPASASTNVSLATFDAHLKELTGGRYHVRPLLDVLTAIR